MTRRLALSRSVGIRRDRVRDGSREADGIVVEPAERLPVADEVPKPLAELRKERRLQ